MRLVVFASCAATASALLWPMPSPMRKPASRAQRAGPLFNAVGQWTATVDEASGETFYYNEQTGESQWEAPPGMAGDSQWGAAPPGVATMLPAGWTTGFDEASGETFYVNEQTGESQWEAPTGMAGDSQWETAPQAEGGLDFENYRQFVADSGEYLPEEELTRRFNELQGFYQSSGQGRRPQPSGQSYNGAYSYGPQRAARMEQDRERRGDRYKDPTGLQEFLRWQEWYIQYCRVRGIGQ